MWETKISALLGLPTVSSREGLYFSVPGLLYGVLWVAVAAGDVRCSGPVPCIARLRTARRHARGDTQRVERLDRALRPPIQGRRAVILIGKEEPEPPYAPGVAVIDVTLGAVFRRHRASPHAELAGAGR